MAQNHLGEDPITVHVHGHRNQVAEFDGGAAELLVGAMATSARVGEPSVLLTVDGRDPKGKIIDIESRSRSARSTRSPRVETAETASVPRCSTDERAR